jgi:PTH1 family peptidyl-tRNA hydrolase
MLVDVLAERMQTTVKRDECRSLVGRGTFDSQTVELAKPLTYMNLSGEAIKCLVAKDGRSIERLVAVSDDLALPLGSIRLRPKGTHGGHNGLRSIIDVLGTQEFIRLRIGIQPEHTLSDTKRFVLENFAKGDAETVEKVLQESADAVETVIREGIDAAMAKYN